ncbi:hypothetical protein NBRC111452_798 [Companilactobacillus farciminis]|nr:hypothetical protein NBRC111452_798 [Companilactobacillus farciminis]
MALALVSVVVAVKIPPTDINAAANIPKIVVFFIKAIPLNYVYLITYILNIIGLNPILDNQKNTALSIISGILL